MKEQIKRFINFIRNNWFKLAIIILFAWFIWTLGHLTIQHRGWIENEAPGFFPSIKL